ncbi:hypothetical protein BOTBODRAFT_33857 [Botryobasidium botryosum FD-172 SS1]|uniref:Uncharacterized protein n=1 Tax=Botryobasidium botryosum (strain FD-172 SS1) TaxID=930990 RepID=A0A067MCG3_BOTB1|nr:hypothetical protein BOTBODRAFT_33857 [Botryobasidium botryosum FD-172 SS1]
MPKTRSGTMYTPGADSAPTDFAAAAADVNDTSATSSLTPLPDADSVSTRPPSEHRLATGGHCDASGEADKIAARPPPSR